MKERERESEEGRVKEARGMVFYLGDVGKANWESSNFSWRDWAGN